MWEFSLNLTDGDLANFLTTSLKNTASVEGGVVTSHIQNGNNCVLIAVPMIKRERMENILTRLITEIICTFYKSSYLDKHLNLPTHEKIGLVAFKKALLNFDRETDYYIIQKNLTFDKDLYLDSFYQFRLGSLKSKWKELVSLANENRDYLISSESFIDLLKFLVDNLDICEREVSVFEEDNGYKICLDGEGEGKLLNEEALVSSIIDLSPQKIHLYCNAMNKATNLLEQIFDQRIIVKTSSSCTQMKKR